ncbi:glutamyl-tRNA synthetase [Thermosulfidibacter takaii ABI70S6]|uniref:Glutamate--tRNA ligase n=1 Tax=Thermosulfidibacter takaii (strain DSM 17441 / JCM 13301 / NBRC 103674 / ABI70S6) TaxID=1298851 RepID=A0A0S3QU56_THET7|nr:glutamate--tRNA ligase [Thermosulfidibacter takaii]BAT71858.1 glutamyl-tRNA synthetase [Thermosulfidibacter takaii ABI70S6]
MKVRFAPSPTGFLHVGNARIALYNYLYSKKHGGEFILRIDDTSEESDPLFEDAIKEDLRWLGLCWDTEFKQSQRKAIYDKFFEELRRRDLVYPCFCSKEQLELDKKVLLSQGKPPRYVGRCRNLTKEEIEKRIKAGEPYCWRFKVSPGVSIAFKDLVKGKALFNSSHFGDFVIRRSDGSYLYMFTSAVDDGLMGITHVFRGEDHFSNTPLQIMIMKALGFGIPEFAHFPLLVNKDGKPFSKRENPPSLRDLASEGYIPEAISLFLFNLGRSHQITEPLNLDQLIKQFDPVHYGTSKTVYSEEQLSFCNRLFIRSMELERLKKLFLSFCGFDEIPKVDIFLEIFRENAVTLKDLCYYYKKVMLADFEPVLLKDEEKDLLYGYLQGQEDLPKGKLFRVLRKVLTGEKQGPPLDRIIELLGKDEVERRIKKALEVNHGD